MQKHSLQSKCKLIDCNAELGCQLVVVLGAKTQIDNYMNMRGLEPKNVKGYRITDEDEMLEAMEEAGTSRMLVEAHLSKVCLHTLPTDLCHGAYAHTTILATRCCLRRHACMI